MEVIHCYCNLDGKYVARHQSEVRAVEYVTILSLKASCSEMNPAPPHKLCLRYRRLPYFQSPRLTFPLAAQKPVFAAF